GGGGCRLIDARILQLPTHCCNQLLPLFFLLSFTISSYSLPPRSKRTAHLRCRLAPLPPPLIPPPSATAGGFFFGGGARRQKRRNRSFCLPPRCLFSRAAVPLLPLFFYPPHPSFAFSEVGVADGCGLRNADPRGEKSFAYFKSHLPVWIFFFFTFDVLVQKGAKGKENCGWRLTAAPVPAEETKGVYVLERDRQQNHQKLEARAPAWWEFFHFQLIRTLVDDADLSIFGAIYEFKCPPFIHNPSMANAPMYVIAFRGTLNKPDSVSRDLGLDLSFIQNGLHKTSRFEIAMQAVRNLLSAVGNRNVWLAGHSLGSAIATLAGKNMAKEGIFLESFLFNPPFVSAPIERIKDKKVKVGLRIASSFVTAGLTMAMKGHREKSEEKFAILSSWVPYLFVNPSDHICCEYIGYFQHREKMEKMGVGGIERLATQNSIGDLLLSAFGKESDPLHLLPSADLTVNLKPSPDFKSAHGIHQWWRPDLHLQCKQYRYS
ncbi:hypothetical protein Taro_040084, partial [Colocasia esculenta]|nr:hypothetical protein [Colocasia esculenta]